MQLRGDERINPRGLYAAGALDEVIAVLRAEAGDDCCGLVEMGHTWDEVADMERDVVRANACRALACCEACLDAWMVDAMSDGALVELGWWMALLGWEISHFMAQPIRATEVMNARADKAVLERKLARTNRGTTCR